MLLTIQFFQLTTGKKTIVLNHNDNNDKEGDEEYDN